MSVNVVTQVGLLGKEKMIEQRVKLDYWYQDVFCGAYLCDIIDSIHFICLLRSVYSTDE